MTFRLTGAVRFAAPIAFAASLSVVFPLYLMTWAAPACAQGINGFEDKEIASIEVKGLANTNPDIIQAILNRNDLKQDQPYHEANVSQARSDIRNQGLYSDVFFKTDTTANGTVALTVQVTENPVVKLVRVKTSIDLKGKNVPTEQSLLPALLSKPGLVLNMQSVRTDAHKIQDKYKAAGYDAYLSEVQDIFDTKTGILTFPVTITTINAIKFTGLHKTKESVLLREMKSKVGDPLNSDQMKKDITRLYNTNLFSDVQNPAIEPADEGTANIIIPVVEQRTGQVQVGFGYSVEERLTGTLQVSDSNFRGRDEAVSASWTVGGVVARSQFDFGFTQPWIDNHHTSLSIDVYDRISYLFNRIFTSTITSGSTSNPYYDERRGATFTISRPVSDTTRVFTTLRAETVTANNLFANDQTLTNDELSNIQGSLVQDGNTVSITFHTLTDLRDNARDPANGYYFSPSIEQGYSQFHYQNPFLNPDYISPVKTPNIDKVLTTTAYDTGPFTKFNIDIRRYFDLGPPRVSLTDPRKVLATRILFGTSAGNIGFSEQYFMGGADNLRGYADDRFWGNHTFLWSTELRMPMAAHGDVTGVLFMDIGDAWGASAQNAENVSGYEQHSGFQPHIGVGPGIRIKTPVGAVRLDYGIGETQRTHFSIGQAF